LPALFSFYGLRSSRRKPQLRGRPILHWIAPCRFFPATGNLSRVYQICRPAIAAVQHRRALPRDLHFFFAACVA